MSIKILTEENKIILKTKNTMYVMEMLHGRFPVHLYYGKNTKNTDFNFDNNYRSFSPYYEEYGKSFSPDTAPLEFSFFGYGDFRSSALKIFNSSSGSDITDFIFRKAKKFRGRKEISGLPYAEGASETLELIFDDAVTKSELHLYYTLFNDCDVISRYFTLKNKGKNDIRIEKCMSLSLDIQNKECDLISFQSKYFYERHVCREPLYQGNRRITSRRGSSSHHANPFFVIADRKATEEKGEAYGFNFVYSGSYLNEIEVDQNGTVRAMVGLGDECFNYLLCADEEFTSPEAIMTYSAKGIGEISRNMHSFVRSHILPADVFAKRPVVLNSWEAFHFDIDEETMVNFAKSAVECGMDMVVMDDGWFGSRRNDKAGLGDWTPSHELFKNGLRAFVDRVRSTGVKFGIWIEPEMVNPDSDLYRAHPDWVLHVEGRDRSIGRYTAVLDLSRKEVEDYVFEAVSKILRSADISYVKWDFNRNLTEVGSKALPCDQQKEVFHRYVLGVYSLAERLTSTFPDILFEGCSGGGGRFDCGMFYYFPQIWTSDDTDAFERCKIQYGSSVGYPASVMSAHVSASPNHQTFREMPFKTRGDVATSGAFGYELDLSIISEEEKEMVKAQVERYKELYDTIVNGDNYRLIDPFTNNRWCAWEYVSEDKSQAVLTYVVTRFKVKGRYHIKLKGLDPDATYREKVSGRCYKGNTLMNVGINLGNDLHEAHSDIVVFDKV